MRDFPRAGSAASEHAPVLLVCMPWKDVVSPSIQLGLLKALLAREGIGAHVANYYLRFAEHLTQGGGGRGRRFSIRAYRAISEVSDYEGVGEWAFAVPPYRDVSPERDASYRAFLAAAKYSETRIANLFAIRELVPSFLEQCLADVLARRPRAVGFTTVFRQNVPSLALARMIKERAPETAIVFGGANCEGVMGEALARAFPFVDVVVRGEADHLVGPLFRDLLDGGPVRAQPGLCIRRRGGELEVCPPAAGGTTMPLDDIPTPCYDEYFADLAEVGFAAEIDASVNIPFETSRGCWWGAKHHCTFCGLNGTTMSFRRKSDARAYEIITELAARYRRLELVATDNIIDMQYFRELLPRLAADPADYRLFYETKANLSWDRLVAMRAAGVTRLQPGIESLSTDVLRIMNKGITALQNVRLLKWANVLGIELGWNLLYGFPRERPEDYAATARLVPRLHHLQPPGAVGQLRLDRFSPFHTRPEELGLELLDALPFYYHLYDAPPAAVRDLAYYFAYRHADGRDPTSYIGPVKRAVSYWRGLWHERRPRLTYRRGPGFLVIDDERAGSGPPARTTLGAAEAELYLLCDAGVSVPHLVDELALRSPTADAPSEAWVVDAVGVLEERGLLFAEDGKYLSLAVPREAWRASARDEVRAAGREGAALQTSEASIG